MRKLFSRQLIEARHEMLSIYEEVDLALHDAVNAFVEDDKKLANKTKKRTLTIDARCANLEAVCYNLIATQSPVASDFRLLQTIIYIDFNLQRMNDKVRAVTRAAKRKIKGEFEVPQELIDLIKKQAEATYRVLGSSVTALVNNDLSVVCTLAEEDAPVHDIYQEFFRTYNRLGIDVADDNSLDDVRRVVMVSRYLDRLASISVDAACRLTFLLTGQRWTANDIADADEEELESMRIPAGEGSIMDAQTDAEYVSNLPLDEVGEELKKLIENVQNDTVDEDE
jgi:phosphate transport system protein